LVFYPENPANPENPDSDKKEFFRIKLKSIFDWFYPESRVNLDKE